MSASALTCAALSPAIASGARKHVFKPVEAKYWERLKEEKVKCVLCPKECQVADRERGYCGVRENMKGKYYTLVHSRICSAHIDPVEKKPLYHFLPGVNAFSIATAGCNMECKFCQNWEISQFRPEQIKNSYVTPRGIARFALRNKASVIAYTYSEPVIFYEYMYDCAVEGNKLGLKSVMISNGYIQKKPMNELIDVLSAVKVDLKAFTEKFYKKQCDAEMKPVLETLELLKKRGIWFEIVVLIIPTLNDSPEENRQMARWIKKNLGKDVPVHFSRFHPTYKIKNLPRTPVSTLVRIHDIAREEGLRYVYCGNIPGHKTGHTYCHSCGKILIKRWGYRIVENNLKAPGNCRFCKTSIPGVWF
jgi:pyruvate formate lyase activating enzyme